MVQPVNGKGHPARDDDRTGEIRCGLNFKIEATGRGKRRFVSISLSEVMSDKAKCGVIENAKLHHARRNPPRMKGNVIGAANRTNYFSWCEKKLEGVMKRSGANGGGAWAYGACLSFTLNTSEARNYGKLYC